MKINVVITEYRKEREECLRERQRERKRDKKMRK